MILVRRIPYGVVLTISFIIGLLGCFYSIRIVSRPRFISVYYDTFFASHIQKKLTQDISKKSNSIAIYTASLLLEELKKYFPLIHHLSIRYKSDRNAHIKLKAAQPLLLIHESLLGNLYVLTSQGVLAADLYETTMLQEKNTIIVHNNDYLAESAQSSFYSCTCLIPDTLFRLYTITWHSQHEIVLQDKNSGLLIIVADAKTVLNQERITFAENIYKNNYQKLKKQKKIMKADIRLGDFMVCAHLRGGGL